MMLKSLVFSLVLVVSSFSLVSHEASKGDAVNLEGTYKIDKKTSQLILELQLLREPSDTAFEDFSAKMSNSLKQIEIDSSTPGVLKITLGLVPVDEPEFDGEGPTKEELNAEFASLQGGHS